MSSSQASEEVREGLRVLDQLTRRAIEKQRELIAMSEPDQMLEIRLQQLLGAQRLVDEGLQGMPSGEAADVL